MKCHYEVLGVSREADESEIKKAYRKLALRWHPDKNLDQLEEAKQQFQLVQQAYEVLSDPQERSWYDNHREQILRGKSSNYEDNCLDLFQYFTVSCFKGYGNDPGGFYQVYREVFEKIASEDLEFCDDEEMEQVPKFGDLSSNYEEVVGPFYAYWQSYCTKRSYAWLCPYNISEIKDRRILREIEKDMKKIVQKAKRERNDEVRNLVSFVRKRDKRVQAYRKQLEEKAALNRQKQEHVRLEQIRKRKEQIDECKKKLNSSLQEKYEEQLKQLEQEYGDSDEEDFFETDESDEETKNSIEGLNVDEISPMTDLYCVACNKAFKNENAFLNHESSKKHRENIEKLKTEMLEEDEVFFHQTLDKLSLDSANEDQNLDEDEDQASQNDEKKNKPKKNKKSKKSQNVAKVVDEEEPLSNLLEITDDEDYNWNDDKKLNKKQKSKKPITKIAKNSSAPQEKVEEPKQVDKTTHSIKDNMDVNHTCVTCKSGFESKNKLFQHLKKTNHGVYLPKSEVKPATGADNVSRKRTRNK